MKKSTSLIRASISTYCNPFCKNDINAPGGKSVVVNVDLANKLSYANVNAEWTNPNNKIQSYKINKLIKIIKTLNK